MSKIKVYTKDFCPYCVKAKDLLKKKNLEFEEINLEGKFDEINALKEKTGMRTLPQIFIDEKLVGGFSELQKLDLDGKL